MTGLVVFSSNLASDVSIRFNERACSKLRARPVCGSVSSPVDALNNPLLINSSADSCPPDPSR